MSDPWVESTQLWYNTTYGNRQGWQSIAVTGQPGWRTMYALTRALQHELGLTALSDNFGSGTLAALTTYGSISSSNPNTATNPSNIVKILQGALYCKGYNAANGDLTGRWGPLMDAAVSSLRQDLGLSSSTSVIPKLFKFLLTMDAAKLLGGGDAVVRAGQQLMNSRYLNRRDFYLVPADGYFLRDTHRALLFAIQYEIGLLDGVANGNFGPATKTGLQQKAALSPGSSDTTGAFVRLFHLALRVNGYPTSLSTAYSSTTASHASAFQTFVGLSASGLANLQTWAALLVSTGDPDRPATGADMVMTLTPERLTTLRNAGYRYFGRYLTNTPDHRLDKCIKRGEIERILTAGGRLFPIFQTGGGDPDHFTFKRGEQVGDEAAAAAWAYGIPTNSVIYFAVDFDALPYQVTDLIIPYFQGVHERLGRTGRAYRVGIYGPRDVCRMVVDAGLAVHSFVSDMSTGYAGNLGQPLPQSWAFDQIQTLWMGSGAGLVEIDKVVVSGRDGGLTSLSPTITNRTDRTIPASKLDSFESDWYRACWENEDTVVQQLLMPANRAGIKDRISRHDAFITSLAQTLKVPKALIMTPLIWEGMVIRADDDAQDAAVSTYYSSMELTGSAPPGLPDDSSTGIAQMFARTGIRANNWGVERGIITSRTYDAGNWRDVWSMWRLIHNDEESAIRLAAMNMLAEAEEGPGVPRTEIWEMTPSQVMAMCTGYNGSWFEAPGTSALIYGRRRMILYYVIQRWQQTFN